jgi:hypothetical protein
MNIEFLAYGAVFLVTFTSAGLLISQSWRVSIGLLAIQYIGVFVLILPGWPIEMAIVKMVAGWISGAVIGLMISSTRIAYERDEVWPAGRLFRLLMIVLVLFAVWSLVPSALTWIPGINSMQLTGGLILISMGLLHLSLITQPLRMILGLFTFLAGFEIIYAAVETSILVAGLLAGVTLMLALTAAYLISVPIQDESI